MHVAEGVRLGGPSYSMLRIPVPGESPIELLIYAKMPPGSADLEMRQSHVYQLAHETFTDEFFEASAKVFNTDFQLGEKTAVYTFLVGKKDLQFHRHEGHRIIVGVVGSGGAVFRFSHASPDEERRDPTLFVGKMSVIEMPPDCRFALRFSGRVYHQFGPLDPAFDAVFAVSIHTDEAGGLSGDVLETVLQDQASIPLLTETISDATQMYLDRHAGDRSVGRYHRMPLSM